MPTKLAVLVSGSGTLLEAMIKEGLLISLVGADRQCRGIRIAIDANVPRVVVMPHSFTGDFNRRKYTLGVVELLRREEINLVAMAGFRTVFDPVIFERFNGSILNSHPALLPSFKGDSAVADALKFGAKVTGTTIHRATAKLDDGPIIAQKAVAVVEGDTVDSLHERIKVVERRLYVDVLRRFL